MADITLCQFHSCPLKETCVRYITKPNSRYQSYLLASELYTVIEKEFQCRMYWPTNEVQQ